MSHTWLPRVLVVGPGGVKGLKVLGFLTPLEDAKLLRAVDTYCGVSIGAIICLLLAAGYSIREIVGEAVTLDIFKDISGFNWREAMSHRGVLSNEPVQHRLCNLLVLKFGHVPTLHELYEVTHNSFIAVTYNVTNSICAMMGPQTHPDVSCVDAVLCSMNIPFVFYQLIYQDKTYIDGAFGNPYPVDYFDNGSTDILGIYIKDPDTAYENPELPVQVYFSKIIHALMERTRNKIIHDSSEHCKHVKIQTHIHDTVGTNMTLENKARMLVDGNNEGREFIQDIHNHRYQRPVIPPDVKYTYPERLEIHNST